MHSQALQIEILQATPADVGALAPLFDAYRQFYKKPSNEEAARRFLFARLSKGESVLFFAQHEQTAVGFVHLYPVFSSTNLTRQWILNDLFVAPDARKHGVAHALMDAPASSPRAPRPTAWRSRPPPITTPRNGYTSSWAGSATKSFTATSWRSEAS